MRDFVVERVKQWLRESPEASIVSVSQNDWHGACACENCITGTGLALSRRTHLHQSHDGGQLGSRRLSHEPSFRMLVPSGHWIVELALLPGFGRRTCMRMATSHMGSTAAVALVD